MSFGPTGIYTHDGTSAASIRIATASMESSLRNRIIGTFANTTARDAAYSGLSSAQKQGIHAWIVNREGLSFWDATSNKWSWVSVNRTLIDQTRPSAADTSGGGLGIQIILSPVVTLPPGNRLIQVYANASVTNIGTTNAKLARIYVNSGTIRSQVYLPAGTTDVTLRIDGATFVANGTVDVDLWGLTTSAGDAARFTGSSLRVIDCGPTDD